MNATTPLQPPIRFPIEGMTCASCAGRVDKALHTIPGVREVSVNLASETVQLSTAAAISWPAVAAAVDAAGYQLGTVTVPLTIGGMRPSGGI